MVEISTNLLTIWGSQAIGRIELQVLEQNHEE